MKSATFGLALFFTVVAQASAYEWLTPRLKCEWRAVGSEAQAGVDASNYLLGFPCDSDRNAAIQARFARIDAESLAAYNRGLNLMPHRASPVGRPGR